MQFTPAIYEHAAKVINKTPWEVSRSPELLYQAHIAAYQLYHHSPVMIGIDVYNLEPEAYGAEIREPEGYAIPAISSHPYTEISDLLVLKNFDPENDGRIPMVIQAAEKVVADLPGVDVKVPISGPFSIANNLAGFDALLFNLVLEPELIKNILYKLVDGQIAFCKACAKRNLPISLFESAASPPIISPDMFTNIILPPLQHLIQQATEITKSAVSCIIGGNTAPVIQDILKTGARYVICPSETDQQEFMQIMEAYPDIMVRINMDPRVFTSDDRDQLYIEIDRVFELAKNRERVCIGTGVLPYETDPEMVFTAREYIRNKKR